MQAARSERSPAPVRFVTGVDQHYFDQLYLLFGSLRRYSPTAKHNVCDLGLTEAQRALLRLQDCLLEAPTDLPPPRHPWDRKAALFRFVEKFGDDPIMWLDSDLIIMTDIAAAADRFVSEMEAEGADLLVTSMCSLADQMGIDPAPYYASQVAGYDLALPYVSSGIFISRSPLFLKDWYDQTCAMSLEMLYEQNAFNLVAHRLKKLKLVDTEIWNLSSHPLQEMRQELRDGQPGVFLGDKAINILHLTSNNRPRDLINIKQVFVLNDRRLEAHFRLLRRPDFGEFQMALICEAIAAMQGDIVAAGLTTLEAGKHQTA